MKKSKILRYMSDVFHSTFILLCSSKSLWLWPTTNINRNFTLGTAGYAVLKCNNVVPTAWKLRGPFRVQEPTTAFVLDLRVLSDRDDVHGRIWRRFLPDGSRPHIPSIFSTRRFGKLSLHILYTRNLELMSIKKLF